MTALSSMPPKYAKVAKRVEDVAAPILASEPSSIGLRIVVEEGSSRAEIRTAQKQAIAEHLARHPEDRGRKVDP